MEVLWHFMCECAHQWSVRLLDGEEPGDDVVVCERCGCEAVTAERRPAGDRVSVLVQQDSWVVDSATNRTADSGLLRLTVRDSEGRTRTLDPLPARHALVWLEDFLGRTSSEVWRKIDRNKLDRSGSAERGGHEELS